MYYGFDIGGTKIAFGVYDQKQQLQWQTRVATPHDSYQHFLDTVISLVEQADERFGCCGSVGIGVPGIPENDDGVLYAVNVPAASGKRLRLDLSDRLNREVLIDNDANCFTLSEALSDESRHYPVVMGLILGTGVGGGVVINGKSMTGRNYTAGEFGHTCLPASALNILGRDIPIIRCGCGQDWCIENYLSGRGFAWLWQHFYHQPLDAKAIISRYQQADKQAIEHVDRFLELLAACLGNFLTALDPHLLVIGGGLSQFNVIYQQLSVRLPKYLLPVAAIPRIEPARYGDAGGMRGAALLHFSE